VKKKEIFVWIADDAWTRSKMGRRAMKLKRGEEYEVEFFGAGVVDLWVKTGFAKYKESLKNKIENGGE